jgi:hypothetical protein
MNTTTPFKKLASMSLQDGCALQLSTYTRKILRTTIKETYQRLHHTLYRSGTESPPKVNTQISPHSTPLLIPVKCFKHNRLWSAVLSPFVRPSVLDQSCQSWKQRRCSAQEQLTILCLIIISPGVVTLCPTLKCLCIQSAIYYPLRFSLLTCQVVWSKAFKGCWKFILWTLTNTAITQPAHAIIWPEWTITPQPYLQSTTPTVHSEYTRLSCSIRRTTVSEHPGGRNPTELKWAP